MTAEVFTRTDDQRLAALARANHIRFYRADYKRALKTGDADVILALADPPDELASMKVLNLLCALPKWGPRRARQTLGGLRISDSKTVGGLSSRQRSVLIAELTA